MYVEKISIFLLYCISKLFHFENSIIDRPFEKNKNKFTYSGQKNIYSLIVVLFGNYNISNMLFYQHPFYHLVQ